MESTAIFYPNLMNLLKVRIDGIKLLATHDDGTACHDMRHFIDKRALQSVDKDGTLMENIVDPNPSCTRITGKLMDNEVVVGMLSSPLDVRCKVGHGDEKQFVDLVLDRVLVIENLPVPLHISMKSLRAKGECPEGIDLILYNSERINFSAENVPEEYRSHPYYGLGKDGMRTIFMPNLPISDHTRLYSMQKQQLQGSHNSSQHGSCKLCGVRNVPMKMCGRCKRVLYCCVEHQTEDWKRHKHEDSCIRKK
jgi:hypothetical protein